jgi:predicted ATPase
MRRDIQALSDYGDEVIRLSDRLGFTSFSGTGNCYRGEALSRVGQVDEGVAQIRQGLAARQSIGVQLCETAVLVGLAGALARAGQVQEGLQTLARTLAMVETSDERYCEAEVHRVRGDLLCMEGDPSAAEASFLRALEVARRQDAKSWELRAATSLARLWQQGRQDEAREMLAEVYGWFTEGFDTPDLVEAAALREELA